ncbi:hypothetical protein ACFOD0_15515 [Shewanella intestini]|uniref:DUF2987 domain-containing protein n=1 Tax=Shewanella intestini TaxID=2017544 RepID=A0ABS5I4Z5_9GAMM|nr:MULTISPECIES: hypothetical protein [Shewanella]MBR9729103.1 hypothetical protein [Shewanella intestini]MRG37179.1 hypothetical protein [Shewanella sp. XMDDZSB0408]
MPRLLRFYLRLLPLIFTSLMLVSPSLNATSGHSHHLEVSSPLEHSHVNVSPALPKSVGLHGMLLFGSKDAIFASHLPMFHPPHNAQVVFELTFNDTHIQQRIQQQFATLSATPIWTIVPQPFDLARLAPNAEKPLTQLTVDIFEGHFERGGKRIYQHAVIEVKHMLLFNPLSIETKQPAKTFATYIAIGQQNNDETQFLIKLLSTRPDADQLIKLSHIRSALPSTFTLPLHGQLSAPVEQIQQHINEQAPQVIATPLYLEINELR